MRERLSSGVILIGDYKPPEDHPILNFLEILFVCIIFIGIPVAGFIVGLICGILKLAE